MTDTPAVDALWSSAITLADLAMMPPTARVFTNADALARHEDLAEQG